MNPQYQEFNKALESLTPQERATYTSKNPTVMVGGQSISFNPQLSTLSTLNANSLQPAPQYSLPEARPETSAAGLSAMAMGMAQSPSSSSQVDNLEKKTSDSGSMLFDKLMSKKSENQLKAEHYGEADTTEQELNDINMRMLSSERAMTNELKDLDASFRGTLDGKRQAAQSIQRRYASEQADLAVIQMAKQGRYNSAKAIADRKISAALEQQQNEIDAYKFIYSENKELFTKAEQRQFESILRQKEREYDSEERTVKQLSDAKLTLLQSASSQGASMDILQRINNATNLADAFIAAGQYSGDILAKRLQEAELSEIQEKTNMPVGEQSAYRQERGTRIIQSVDELIRATNFNNVGISSLWKIVPGTVQRNYKADLETLKANIAFSELQAMREASKTGGALGQVAIRELELLESTLGALDQGQGPANMKKNLEKVKESLNRWYTAAGSQTGEVEQLRAAGYSQEQIQQIINAK